MNLRKIVFIGVIFFFIYFAFLYFNKKIISQEMNIDKVEKVSTDEIKENTSWKITQYGENTGNQMTGYTIEGNNYGLVIVDGGYFHDVNMQEKYKELIRKNNNKVDAWILTHYDVDHAGAFLGILDSFPELEIGKLYTQGMPDLKLAQEKAPWDGDWTIYERYLNEDFPYREVTYDGFEVENIIGLKYKVLSVYDKWMDNKLTSLLNSGSMIFKLYGNEESIMFCADVTTNIIEDNIMKNYAEYIPSDYIQVAHHGNSTFSEDFYKLVNPKVAFFDAPSSIYYNVNNVSWFTIEKTAKMFEEWGVKIYNFETAPNSIQMK